MNNVSFMLIAKMCQKACGHLIFKISLGILGGMPPRPPKSLCARDSRYG